MASMRNARGDRDVHSTTTRSESAGPGVTRENVSSVAAAAASKLSLNRLRGLNMSPEVSTWPSLSPFSRLAVNRLCDLNFLKPGPLLSS